MKKNPFVIYLLMFNMFIIMAGIGLIVPIMPRYLETFGAAGQALGLIIAAFAFAQFVFSPIAGDLSDKYGRKKLIVIGLALFGFSQLWFGIATHEWMLYAARFISGIGGAFLIPPTMAFVADITTYEERGKGMGYIGAAMSLGFMIGPGIGGLFSAISLNFPFYVSAGTAIVAMIISLFVLPDIRNKEVAAPDKKRENIVQQMRRSFHTPYFVMLLIIFVFSFGIANFQATFALYMNYKFDFTPEQIAIVLTAGGFVGVVIQMFLIDRLFKRFGEMGIILSSLAFAAVTLYGMLFVNQFFSILLVATLFSIAVTLIRPAVNTVVSKLAGAEQGFAAGMNNAYMSLGNMVGPALAGILFDFDYNLPFTVGAIVLLGTFFMTYIWMKKKDINLQATQTEHGPL